jgi:hypothetical protein
MRPGRSTRRHIFITGAPRSGTTLLKTILTVHPDLSGSDYESTGLFKFRNLYTYYCGEIGLQEMQALVRASHDLVSLYGDVADWMLARYGGRIFVDKVWPGMGRIPFACKHFPNARWIHIVRDGRDCFCSARHHPNIPQNRSAGIFARHWRKCVRQAESLIPDHQRLTVRYEDLAREPQVVVPEIMRFIEVPFVPEQLEGMARGKTTSIKKRAPHERLARPIDASTVSRWRDELTPEEAEVFQRIAGQELEKWGYTDPVRRP